MLAVLGLRKLGLPLGNNCLLLLDQFTFARDGSVDTIAIVFLERPHPLGVLGIEALFQFPRVRLSRFRHVSHRRTCLRHSGFVTGYCRSTTAGSGAKT